MADIQITIDSADVRALLQRAPQALEYAIVGALNDSASYFLARMKTYPAPPPNSQYRRTGTLARSWSVRPVVRTSNGWQIQTGSSGNIAPYNRFVLDRAKQKQIFRGRWATAQTVVEQSHSQIQRFVDARVRAALG